MTPRIHTPILMACMVSLICLGITSCSSSGVRMARSAQQQSLSDGVLSQSIRDSIATREQRDNKSCSSHAVKRVSLQSSARGASGNLMTARENWYINSCGRETVYQVDYYGPIHENTPTDVKPIRR